MLQHIATRWPNANNMFAQQCCDMLRWHVAVVWPGLNAPGKSKLLVNLNPQQFAKLASNHPCYLKELGLTICVIEFKYEQ